MSAAQAIVHVFPLVVILCGTCIQHGCPGIGGRDATMEMRSEY
jgi:hypothetical protein